MLQAGAAIGAGIAAPINDRWGRKKAMMVGAACGVVGAALQSGAVSTAMLIVGRLIIGIAIGIMTMVVPVYQVWATTTLHKIQLSHTDSRLKLLLHMNGLSS